MCDSGTDDTKVRCIKWRPAGEHQWCIVPMDKAEVMLDDMRETESDEPYEVMLDTLTQHEIDNLPEHDGW